MCLYEFLASFPRVPAIMLEPRHLVPGNLEQWEHSYVFKLGTSEIPDNHAFLCVVVLAAAHVTFLCIFCETPFKNALSMMNIHHTKRRLTVSCRFIVCTLESDGDAY
jgi:hypothetical protein